MPRNMSFALTTKQIEDETKDVTRRNGWWFLKPGDQIWAVEKCMGLKKGEKVIVDVPVQLIGEAKSDALVVTEQATLSIEAEATHIPELLEISIEGLEAGTQILASDVELPKGSTLLTDEDALIVNVTHAPTAEEVEAELAEAEADNAGEPAQPAVVGEDSSEE